MGREPVHVKENATARRLTCRQAGARMEHWAPPALAEPWDNVGWMFGDPDQVMTGILVALDLTGDVLRQAEALGLNLIVTHHPPLFTPLRQVTTETWEGRMASRCFRSGLSVFSAHTNADATSGGVGDLLAQALCLVQAEPFPGPASTGLEGRGRMGVLPEDLSPHAFVRMLERKLATTSVRCIGLAPERVSRIVVQNGAYDRDLLPALMACRPDAVVTGDVKHHDALALAEAGLFAVDAGHQVTELPFCRHVASMLAEAFPSLPVQLAVEQEVYRGL